MRFMARFVALGSWLLAMPALAQEYQPYPSPRITPEQWAAYGEIVQHNHGETAEIYKDKRLVGFSDQRNRMFWVFTMKGHPAHPAFITRQLFEEDGEVRVRQIGYFAGSEEEFAKLFGEYLERNESLKDQVGRRNR
ncbi:MAG TPA: hypothetical protein VFR29_00325 [Steroidobacteraceae bacterium]|nr:hypothetical protein [Steroidobacteraceae bacterium]